MPSDPKPMPDQHINTTTTRYKPCQTLDDHSIPYSIWFEDALFHYGVPTVLFDLYLMVKDIDAAAEILLKEGWIIDTQSPHRIGNAEVELPQRPLLSPDRDSKVILLPSADWNFALTSDSLHRAPLGPRYLGPELLFPTLPNLLDTLIQSWLDIPSEDPVLVLHLACQISYLYEYVPTLKEGSFADQLRVEHRRFHCDVLAGMRIGRFVGMVGRFEMGCCEGRKRPSSIFLFGEIFSSGGFVVNDRQKKIPGLRRSWYERGKQT